jgi:16S rRNA processing protein RimM
MPAYDPRTIAIGVLGKPHGVRGEIALRLYNHDPPELDDLGTVELVRDGRREARTVEHVRAFGGGLLVTLAGVTTREMAAALTHSEVRVDRSALPAPAPGEYYVSDVPGCTVQDMSGARLGVVRETFWNGAHDVMVVVGDGGGAASEHLIPLVPDYVRAVDEGRRTVLVDWTAEDDAAVEEVADDHGR